MESRSDYPQTKEPGTHPPTHELTFYRPISLLPIISKVLEKLLLKTLGIHVQHGNPRTLPIGGSSRNNGRTMVRAKYDNAEESPNSNVSKRNQPL
jgi:hypothetical protein